MRKIMMILALTAVVTFTAGAQDMYYAKMLSQNNYIGSARTLGMNNAVTAIGGDLGTIGINPAGSAVAPYYQFTISPGMTMSVVTSDYTPYRNGDITSNVERNSRMTLPNIGLSMVVETGRPYGLKQVTYAFVSNSTQSFQRFATGYGANSVNSMLGSMAAAANGYTSSELSNSNSVNWDLYSSYAANQFGGYADGLVYAGSNQAIDRNDSYTYLPGTLNQTSTTNTWGSKNDYIFNIGLNYNDRLYIGFNFGIPTLRYTRKDIFSEAAQDPDQFQLIFVNGNNTETARYISSSNTYQLATKADGVYAKAGVIYRPNNSLRLGAAFQTPTVMTISEQWLYSASTTFDKTAYSGKGESPEGSYSYCLRTPYILDLGVAYTLSQKALVSVDYELMDYSVMKYSDIDADELDYDYFATTNTINNKFCGVSHSLRVGAEYRLTDMFALRAGWSMITDPERTWTGDGGETVTADNYLGSYGSPAYVSLSDPKYVGNTVTSFSVGAGYVSYGSFFADVAVRATKYPETTFSPYYYSAYTAYDANGNSLGATSPTQKISNMLMDAVLTIGWRF